MLQKVMTQNFIFEAEPQNLVNKSLSGCISSINSSSRFMNYILLLSFSRSKHFFKLLFISLIVAISSAASAGENLSNQDLNKPFKRPASLAISVVGRI